MGGATLNKSVMALHHNRVAVGATLNKSVMALHHNRVAVGATLNKSVMALNYNITRHLHCQCLCYCFAAGQSEWVITKQFALWRCQ